MLGQIYSFIKANGGTQLQTNWKLTGIVLANPGHSDLGTG